MEATEFKKRVDAIAEDKGLDDRTFRREVKRMLGRIEGEKPKVALVTRKRAAVVK